MKWDRPSTAPCHVTLTRQVTSTPHPALYIAPPDRPPAAAALHNQVNAGVSRPNLAVWCCHKQHWAANALSRVYEGAGGALKGFHGLAHSIYGSHGKKTYENQVFWWGKWPIPHHHHANMLQYCIVNNTSILHPPPPSICWCNPPSRADGRLACRRRPGAGCGEVGGRSHVAVLNMAGICVRPACDSFLYHCDVSLFSPTCHYS